MNNVVVVPWFSREEWIETYEAAFSSDVTRWKDAKDTMLVWQARVEKLPAGIDVTLPLLQAKVVDADPTVESAVKSIFMASALQRFVTSIVKLPQTKYYRAQSMHNLALEIGLPMHLVDLRNEIVHGHGGWAGGETVERGLEVAYSWIKGYYWDAEFNKIQMNDAERSGIPHEEWEEFISLLRKFAKVTVSSAKKNVQVYKKVKKSLIQSLTSLYWLDPEEYTKAIVSHVLLSDANQREAEDSCECGCCIDVQVLERVEPVITFFCSVEGGIELLLSFLIERTQEHSKLSSEWICVICGALLEVPCFSSQEPHCDGHTLVLEEVPEEVEWRRVVGDLLAAQAQWSTEAARMIMDSPKTTITESQVERIEDLLSVFSGDSKVCSAKDGKACKPVSEEPYTVDTILSEAKHLPLGDRRKLERLRISILGIPPESESDESPLGVLPEQGGNPLFYKELILHYPPSGTAPPPSKRLKLQDPLG